MRSHPNPRLLRLLGGDALANLRKRLRQRYERGDDAFAFRLTGLTDAERSALAGLLGRPLRLASSMKLDSASLDAALRNAGIADSLRDALEQLDGPVINRAALHTALQRQWHNLSASCADPRLVTLMAEPNGLRLLKRLSRNNPDVGANLIDAAQ